jgi:ribose-phosphate pyrophosphokinase
MREKMKLIAGNSNKSLFKKISQLIGVPLCDTEIKRFSDGEIRVKINENIRGMDVFILQSTNTPAENLLELLILIDAACRSSAERITAVIPYFGYARQDRKDQPRVPISAKLVANLIVTAGAERVLTMDLHAAQIQGFFDIPTDHLFSNPVFFEYLSRFDLKDFVAITDIGTIKMVRNFAKKLNAPMAVLDKRRPEPNQIVETHIIGEVSGKNAIIRDDMADTGGTLVEAALALRKEGAKRIVACCTHPVLSGNAIDLIEKSPIEKLVISDTISTEDKKLSSKFEIVSVAKMFAEAIMRIHKEESVSILFD